MLTVTYYKIANRWYLDLPSYAKRGNPDDLEIMGGAYDLLELCAEGRSTIKALIATKPFEGADVATLTGTSGDQTGAYYHIATYKGKVVNLEIWIGDLIYRFKAALPQKIYGKVID
jgi:hypothetical protein